MTLTFPTAVITAWCRLTVSGRLQVVPQRIFVIFFIVFYATPITINHKTLVARSRGNRVVNGSPQRPEYENWRVGSTRLVVLTFRINNVLRIFRARLNYYGTDGRHLLPTLIEKNWSLWWIFPSSAQPRFASVVFNSLPIQHVIRLTETIKRSRLYLRSISICKFWEKKKTFVWRSNV